MREDVVTKDIQWVGEPVGLDKSRRSACMSKLINAAVKEQSLLLELLIYELEYHFPSEK